ncbi:YtxH domain-containing protein [Candidatus Ozemobacteraceae bacterium]|nr:YtxH domain-containing protein [Candidatus Ozemobacteraceae bacterium]
MPIIARIAGPVIGGALGFAYHKVVGCAGGTCPIVASPYLSVLYGALIGFLVQSGR